MDKIRLGVIGRGWRAQFYLRAAKALPEMFDICGLVTRSEEQGNEIELKWGIKTYRTIDDLMKLEAPEYIVVSVSKDVAHLVIKEAVTKGAAVLAETTPANNMENLLELNKLTKAGAKIQVAEQYHLQPMLESSIKIARSGRLGEVSQAEVSFTQTYHAVSIMRKLLGIGFENAVINARAYKFPVVDGPGRNGPPTAEKLVTPQRVIGTLDFGNKLGVYDFENNQHRSWARSNHIVVRGDRGEIRDSRVKYLKDFITPIEYELRRINTGENGNYEGYHLKGILAGEEFIYTNNFAPASIPDDEIAVAACMYKMGLYARGGSEFYSLAEASQDTYLGFMLEKAVSTGETIKTETQPWAE